MKLNDQLKGWLVENTQVEATASDEEFVKAATAIGLEVEMPEAAPAVDDALAKTIAEAVAVSIQPLADRVETIGGEVAAMKAAPPVKTVEEVAASLETKKPASPPDSQAKATAVMGAPNAGSPRVDVVPMDKLYSDTRKSLFYGADHPTLADRPAIFGQDHIRGVIPPSADCMPIPARHMESCSELDYAICGAYFKWAAATQNLTGRALPRRLKMTDRDQQLMEFAINERKWTGIVGRGSRDEVDESADSQNVVHDSRLSEFQRKALIDDSTSGGLEAAPIEFDSAVITTPVLHGELFPLVSVVPMTRGRRVEGFSISNPTFTSGTAEGTAITLFTTDSMVSAFDTTIYNAVGAMEIGQDFESDSPVNMGQLVTQQYGEKAKEWLDNQIANGDGTTEPQGVFNASGITDIGNPAGGANAAPQPDDFITLAFNVAKQYRPPSDWARCVYIGNDTSYRRARAIAVSGTDERRVFGHNVASYEMLEWPFKVQNDIANTVCGFFAMKYYRMYRRLGLTVRVETGGKELARKNLTLIVVRMRWGGKLELGGAGAYSDNWQT